MSNLPSNVVFDFTRYLYYAQILLGTSRVTIKENEAKQRSKIFSLFWIFCMCPVMIYLYVADAAVDLYRKIVIFRMLSNEALVINVLFTRELSTKLYQTCQEITAACHEINNSEKIRKIYWTMFGISISILFNAPYVAHAIYEYVHQETDMKTFLYNIYSQIFCTIIWDLELCLWIQFCSLLRLSLRSVNTLLRKKYINNNDNTTCNRSSVRFVSIRENHSKEDYEILKKSIFIFERTIYSYNLLKQIYKYSIFTYCAKTFILGLLRFQHYLLILHNHNIAAFDAQVNLDLFKTVKGLFLITIMSVTSELYCKEFDDMKKNALQILDIHNDKSEIYEPVHTILWLIEETPPDLMFLGFFELNGTLPFKYVTVFFTYVVVLIQFTFL